MSKRKSPPWNGPAYRRVGCEEAHRAVAILTDPLDLQVWVLVRQGRQSRRTGVFFLSIEYLATDLRRPAREVLDAVLRVCTALGWTFDQPSGFVLIPEALPHLWDGTADQLTGYVREIDLARPPAATRAQYIAIAQQLRQELAARHLLAPEPARGVPAKRVPMTPGERQQRRLQKRIDALTARDAAKVS